MLENLLSLLLLLLLQLWLIREVELVLLRVRQQHLRQAQWMRGTEAAGVTSGGEDGRDRRWSRGGHSLEDGRRRCHVRQREGCGRRSGCGGGGRCGAAGELEWEWGHGVRWGWMMLLLSLLFQLLLLLRLQILVVIIMPRNLRMRRVGLMDSSWRPPRRGRRRRTGRRMRR